MPLYCAFLWHMHQPMYLDPKRGRFMMPWVRLHATKAYMDMQYAVAQQFQQGVQAKVTFNLVPSLLLQLSLYGQGISDDFLDLSRKPASSLSSPEQEFLLKHFFSCHWPTMVEPYPRYAQLLSMRGRDVSGTDSQWIRNRFAVQDLLDLQVWFNLTWMGFAARKLPLVQTLFQKGRFFTEQDKNDLLDLQLEILGGLVNAYAQLWQNGCVEISTTPFYHPILPLLVNTDIAARPRPGVRLPARFSWPEDAHEQLVKASDYINTLFKRTPRGLWPSEGSVCPELVPLFQSAGFRWAATDEAVLFGSLTNSAYESLFQPYRVSVNGGTVDMVFRHHELSDLIGFVYKNSPADVAAQDMINRLKGLHASLSNMKRPPFVAIILDGENPWEYYSDGGEAFLSALYGGIDKDPDLKLTTVSEYLDAYPPNITLDKLYSGSWINGDYGIWIGGDEENRAWNALGKARNAVAQKKAGNELSPDVEAEVMEAIYRAEGSDWFWWYGDQFSTSYAYEFDSLFRMNLQHVYSLLGLPVPEELLKPLRRAVVVQPTVQPTAFLHPTIDGRLTSYWEWQGAGVVSFTDAGGAMHKGRGLLRDIFYGFDIQTFFLRLDAYISWSEWQTEQGEDVNLVVRLATGKTIYSFCFSMQQSDWRMVMHKNDNHVEPVSSNIKWAVQDLLELAVPFAFLGISAGQVCELSVYTERNGLVLDMWPKTGHIMLTVPDNDFERRLWLV
ncbi:MAG: glycoside hydrolase family 57 protein [Dissulfuribacterales bacterium]